MTQNNQDVQQVITDILTEVFSPAYLEVLNESHMHNVPANSQTHFKVTIVCDAFDGKRLIQRHRAVNEVLSAQLAGPVHALALHTYTHQDWLKKQEQVPDSPNCLGGSKT